MAAKGYPGAIHTGSVIAGLAEAAQIPAVACCMPPPPPTTRGDVAAGGRVLGITATGASLAEARHRAYLAVDRIRWPDGFCRRDIGGL